MEKQHADSSATIIPDEVMCRKNVNLEEEMRGNSSLKCEDDDSPSERTTGESDDHKTTQIARMS